MIKSLIFFVIILIICRPVFAREAGETEITTEDGIEVFQNEKYYLLKKNVEILSDDLNLTAQIVKIYFEKDLYDIKELVARDGVKFKSDQYNIEGKGSNVEFNIKNQKIFIYGENSELYLEKTKMSSNGKINLNNIEGSFLIDGPDSKLISDEIYIAGSKIIGNFEIINNNRDISNLVVEDEIKSNIKTDDIEMFAKRAVYNKKKSIIELFKEVTIKRGNEIITGDYGILDTKNNSYKVSSNNSNKVKAIILNSNE